MGSEKMKRRITRVTSLLTLGFFLFSQISFANPGAGVEIAVHPETPGFLRIDIPAELASLDGIWEAPSSANSKTILHIQNAHANYGAQQKIKELLGYLNKTYAIKTIFVEGAAEDLNPDYLKLFPDKARNLELADLLAQQGELTGAELFILGENEDRGPQTTDHSKGTTVDHRLSTVDATRVVAHGIERAELYRSNYEALKKVFGAETLVNRYLAGYESRLEALASKVFTNDLRRVLADWQKFEKGHREFVPYIRSLASDAKELLKLDLESLFAQVEWPQITRLLVLQGMEKDLDIPKAEIEQAKLLGFLKARGVSPRIIAEVENFKEQRLSVHQGLGDAMQPRDVLEALIKEAGPKGFQFRDYPAFSLYAGYLILRSELDAKRLFDEIKVLFGKILGSLAVTPNQKALLELYQDEVLARKLLSLELSRRDWQEAAKRGTQVEMDSLVSRLKDLSESVTKEMNLAPSDVEVRKLSPKFHDEVFALYKAAFSFYEFARQRESVFYEKINAVMGQPGASNKAILITGGFHTDGMTDLFREHNISYGVLTPRLMEKSNEKLYRNSMLENYSSLFERSNLELQLLCQSPETLVSQGVTEKRLLNLLENFYIPVLNKKRVREPRATLDLLVRQLKILMGEFEPVSGTWDEKDVCTISIGKNTVIFSPLDEGGYAVTFKVTPTGKIAKQEIKPVARSEMGRGASPLTPGELLERNQPVPIAGTRSAGPIARSDLRVVTATELRTKAMLMKGGVDSFRTEVAEFHDAANATTGLIPMKNGGVAVLSKFTAYPEMQPLFIGIMRKIFEKLPGGANVRGRKVLSIGPGEGSLEKFVMDEFQAQVSGYEISKELAARAREKGVEVFAENGKELSAEAGMSKLPDASQDVILISEAIGYLDLAVVFREAYRVLKPGGLILITQYPVTSQNAGTISETGFIDYPFDDIARADGVTVRGYKTDLQDSGFQDAATMPLASEAVRQVRPTSDWFKYFKRDVVVNFHYMQKPARAEVRGDEQGLRDVLKGVFASKRTYADGDRGVVVDAPSILSKLNPAEKRLLAGRLFDIKPSLAAAFRETSIESVLERWAQPAMGHTENQLLYVTADGEVVGKWDLTLSPDMSKMGGGDFGVLENKRGTGIGDFLTDSLFRWLGEKQVRVMNIPAEKQSTSYYLRYLMGLAIPRGDLGSGGYTLEIGYDRRDWDNFKVPVKSAVESINKLSLDERRANIQAAKARAAAAAAASAGAAVRGAPSLWERIQGLWAPKPSLEIPDGDSNAKMRQPTARAEMRVEEYRDGRAILPEQDGFTRDAGFYAFQTILNLAGSGRVSIADLRKKIVENIKGYMPEADQKLTDDPVELSVLLAQARFKNVDIVVDDTGVVVTKAAQPPKIRSIDEVKTDPKISGRPVIMMGGPSNVVQDHTKAAAVIEKTIREMYAQDPRTVIAVGTSGFGYAHLIVLIARKVAKELGVESTIISAIPAKHMDWMGDADIYVTVGDDWANDAYYHDLSKLADAIITFDGYAATEREYDSFDGLTMSARHVKTGNQPSEEVIQHIIRSSLDRGYNREQMFLFRTAMKTLEATGLSGVEKDLKVFLTRLLDKLYGGFIDSNRDPITGVLSTKASDLTKGIHNGYTNSQSETAGFEWYTSAVHDALRGALEMEIEARKAKLKEEIARKEGAARELTADEEKIVGMRNVKEKKDGPLTLEGFLNPKKKWQIDLVRENFVSEEAFNMLQRAGVKEGQRINAVNNLYDALVKLWPEERQAERKEFLAGLQATGQKEVLLVLNDTGLVDQLVQAIHDDDAEAKALAVVKMNTIIKMQHIVTMLQEENLVWRLYTDYDALAEVAFLALGLDDVMKDSSLFLGMFEELIKGGFNYDKVPAVGENIRKLSAVQKQVIDAFENKGAIEDAVNQLKARTEVRTSRAEVRATAEEFERKFWEEDLASQGVVRETNPDGTPSNVVLAQAKLVTVGHPPRIDHLPLFIDVDPNISVIRYYIMPKGMPEHEFAQRVDGGKEKPFLEFTPESMVDEHGQKVMMNQFLMTPSQKSKEFLLKRATSQEQRELIEALFDWNKNYGKRNLRYGTRVRYGAQATGRIITTWDKDIDKGVWTTMIDTVYLHHEMEEMGIFEKKGENGFKKVLEVGAGGGHLIATLANRLDGLTDVSYTDISPHALRVARKAIDDNLPSGKKITHHAWVGGGVISLVKSGEKYDLIVINPPYIPIPGFLKGKEQENNPYGGTGLIREMLEYAEALLSDNPNAQIIMHVSSLTEADLPGYIRDLGGNFIIESFGSSKVVPLKIDTMSPEWKEWFAVRGLISKDPNAAKTHGEDYFHTIQAYRIRKVSSQVEQGESDEIKARVRARFKNLNPIRPPPSVEQFDRALDEAFAGDQSKIREFLNVFGYGSEFSFQVWHSNLPEGLILTEQIKLLAFIAKMTLDSRSVSDPKVFSINLRPIIQRLKEPANQREMKRLMRTYSVEQLVSMYKQYVAYMNSGKDEPKDLGIQLFTHYYDKSESLISFGDNRYDLFYDHVLRPAMEAARKAGDGPLLWNETTFAYYYPLFKKFADEVGKEVTMEMLEYYAPIIHDRGYYYAKRDVNKKTADGKPIYQSLDDQVHDERDPFVGGKLNEVMVGCLTEAAQRTYEKFQKMPGAFKLKASDVEPTRLLDFYREHLKMLYAERGESPYEADGKTLKNEVEEKAKYLASVVKPGTSIFNSFARSWAELIADAKTKTMPNENAGFLGEISQVDPSAGASDPARQQYLFLMARQKSQVVNTLILARISRNRVPPGVKNKVAFMNEATHLIWKFVGQYDGPGGYQANDLVRLPYEVLQVEKPDEISKDEPLWRQAIRAKEKKFGLTPEESANNLVEVILEGRQGGARVVFYVGAGISMESGLPDWYSLRNSIMKILMSKANPDPELIKYIDLIFAQNWKISPERTMKTLYEILGGDLLAAFVTLESAIPAENHHNIASMMESGDVLEVVSLNFDTLIERALYERGVFRIRSFEIDASGKVTALKVAEYDAQGRPKEGREFTVPLENAMDGQIHIENVPRKLFFVNDESVLGPEVIEQLTARGIPVLHKVHGSSEPGREHTIIADFEGVDKAFPEAIRDLWIRLLLGNLVLSAGITWRDPDMSQMVMFLASLINKTDDLEKMAFDKRTGRVDEEKLRILKEIRDNKKRLREGRGLYLEAFPTVIAEQWQAMQAFDDGSASSHDNIASIVSKADDILEITTARLNGNAASVREPGKKNADLAAARQEGATKLDVWGGAFVGNDPERVRNVNYAVIKASFEADPSGKFEQEKIALGEVVNWKTGERKGGALSPDELKAYFAMSDAEKRAYLNSRFPLAKIHQARIELIERLRQNGLLLDWQSQDLMSQALRDQYRFAEAYQSYERLVAEKADGSPLSSAPWLKTLGELLASDEARAAYFRDPKKVAQFAEAWRGQRLRLMAFAEMLKMRLNNTKFSPPDATALQETIEALAMFRQVFKIVEKSLDPSDQRTLDRIDASSEEVGVYLAIFRDLPLFHQLHAGVKQGQAPALDQMKALIEGAEVHPKASAEKEVLERALGDYEEKARVLQALLAAPKPNAEDVNAVKEFDEKVKAAKKQLDKASNRLMDSFLDVKAVSFRFTGGKGGDLSLLLDAYLTAFHYFTENWQLDIAEQYLIRLEMLAQLLNLPPSHALVQKMNVYKAYYLLLQSWSGKPDANRMIVEMHSFKQGEMLDDLASLQDKDWWLMVSDLVVQAYWAEGDFKFTAINRSAYEGVFDQILDWFLAYEGRLSDRELSSLFHVFTALFDMKMLRKDPEYHKKLLIASEKLAEQAGLRDETLKQQRLEAAKTGVIPATNFEAIFAYYYHAKAAETGDMDAYRKASEAYKAAIQVATKGAHKLRQSLLLAQLNLDMAQREGVSIYEAAKGKAIETGAAIPYLEAALAAYNGILEYASLVGVDPALGVDAVVKKIGDRRLSIKAEAVRKLLKVDSASVKANDYHKKPGVWSGEEGKWTEPRGWSDSPDPLVIPNDIASGEREVMGSFLGPVQLDAQGRPLNPVETIFGVGRGDLGVYGENPAADPILVRRNAKGNLEILVIERKDTPGKLALPGGMVDRMRGADGRIIREATDVTARRELQEETEVTLDPDQALTSVYHGYVHGDPRNGPFAYLVTEAYVGFIENSEKAMSMVPRAQDDAKEAKWVEVTDDFEQRYSFYANHLDLIKLAMAHISSAQAPSETTPAPKKEQPGARAEIRSASQAQAKVTPTRKEISMAEAMAKKATPAQLEDLARTLKTTTFDAVSKINMSPEKMAGLLPALQLVLAATRGIVSDNPADVATALEVLMGIQALVDAGTWTGFIKKLRTAVPGVPIEISAEGGTVVQVVNQLGDEEEAFVNSIFFNLMLNPTMRFRFLDWESGAAEMERAGRIHELIKKRAEKLNKPEIADQVKIDFVKPGKVSAFFRKIRGSYVVSGTAAALAPLDRDLMTVPLITESLDVQDSKSQPFVRNALIRAARKVTGGSVEAQVAELLKDGAQSGWVKGAERNGIEINSKSLSALKNLSILYVAFQQMSEAA